MQQYRAFTSFSEVSPDLSVMRSRSHDSSISSISPGKCCNKLEAASHPVPMCSSTARALNPLERIIACAHIRAEDMR